MSSELEVYRKQAKLLVRWHRERNHTVAGRIRNLPRFANLTDREALNRNFTLAEAQAIIAHEEGYQTWAALKRHYRSGPKNAAAKSLPDLRVTAALPVLFVADVEKSAAFYRDSLHFSVDFLHGNPPFYGSVSRDGARLHLKWVHDPVFGPGRVDEEGLIMAFLPVENIRALYSEFIAGGVPFEQKLTKQAWGGSDFHVRDPDGNIIAFVG